MFRPPLTSSTRVAISPRLAQQLVVLLPEAILASKLIQVVGCVESSRLERYLLVHETARLDQIPLRSLAQKRIELELQHFDSLRVFVYAAHCHERKQHCQYLPQDPLDARSAVGRKRSRQRNAVALPIKSREYRPQWMDSP